ncbi:beta-ketoacyl-[acyl-carrier-protein] synthase family protein [Sinomonas mesophila]|uniref:beta-ketoacyl-[acyl-carrier-protein] synthase family protein n=1 Tax=Sinomonas mesophila TaxID=1531955 RepID=UPI0009860676|nr:beta-ketoacyl synthase N-terminal-like domain-containing protein [Sinomonas mesophila]
MSMRRNAPMRRVAVTGIGMAGALGREVPQVWGSLLAGGSGIGPISAYDPSALLTQVAGEVPEFDVRPALSKRRAVKLMNRASQLAMSALSGALRDAALDPAALDPSGVGVYMASENQISDATHVLPATLKARRPGGGIDPEALGKAAMEMYPLFFLEGLPAAALFFASEQYGFAGPNAFYSGSADAGASAVGNAFRAVAQGDCSVAVAGAFDDAASWWSMIKMDVLGVLAPAQVDDDEAYRPFSADGRGTVLGDGACMLVLEDLESARARGARIYAEVTGFGAGWDRGAPLEFWRQGPGLATAMRQALREAGLTGAEVGLVLADGSADAVGDAIEASAIAEVCGEPLVTCAHAALGHQLSAAGTLNVALAALALSTGALPPTLTTEPLADYAPPRLVRGGPAMHEARVALALARGLEGQSVAVALAAAPQEAGRPASVPDLEGASS